MGIVSKSFRSDLRAGSSAFGRPIGPIVPGGGGGNGFDDDFETPGALDPGLWSTFQAADTDVVKAGGLLEIDVVEGGSNDSLWFGANQGRLDYQSPGAGPWRFELYGAGPAVLNTPGTPLTFASAEFQFIGMIYHNPTLTTATYQACMAGHRNGNAQFTIEIKNTNAGSSSTRDEGNNVHAGLADLACEKAAGSSGAITWQYRATGDSTWITATNAVNIPANDENWVLGIAAYKFDGFKRDFTGRATGWAKVA